MNDQDPLAQLRDIHLPDPVSAWPPAPGWWIVAFLILAALGAYIIFRVIQYRRNAYRRAAINALQAAWQNYAQNPSQNPATSQQAQSYLQAVNEILKRCALHAYPRVGVERMQGKKWLALLDDSFPSEELHFLQGSGQLLMHGPYQAQPPTQNLKALHKLCRQWIQQHRPVQELVNPGFKPKSLKFKDAVHA